MQKRSALKGRQNAFLDPEMPLESNRIVLGPFSISGLRPGVQFGLGPVLPHSNTPSLRVAGFEDEDEAPFWLSSSLPNIERAF